jgi:hypothetical protein
MKLYTIAIMDQETRRILVTWTDVRASDLQGTNKALIGAIMEWLRRWIV